MFDMTRTIIENFFSKAHTRLYPLQTREPFPNVRGNLFNNIEECILCGMCQKKCPSQCITVDKDAKTWQVDPYACVYCGICVESCPVNCLYMESPHRKPTAEKIMNQMVQVKGPEKKKKAAEK
ncbi:MAG: hypothetical protein JG774_1574 [Desulfomicrobiaceae bacterium]|jgi:formate hydrogenlyase subunit 6/NADH:ubiquinone oxidoreductase subunit I|nr:hypothetical protein [Desulfomicrobiaceae bacterium]